MSFLKEPLLGNPIEQWLMALLVLLVLVGGILLVRNIVGQLFDFKRNPYLCGTKLAGPGY
jgi:hypothetical protein